MNNENNGFNQNPQANNTFVNPPNGVDTNLNGGVQDGISPQVNNPNNVGYTNNIQNNVQAMNSGDNNLNQMTPSNNIPNNMNNMPQNNYGASENMQPKKNNTVMIAIIVVVALLLLVAVYFLFIKKDNEHGGEVNDNGIFIEKKDETVKYEENIKLIKEELVDFSNKYASEKVIFLSVKNNNKVAVNIDVTLELYDEENNLIDTRQDMIFSVNSGREVISDFTIYNKEFASYKYYFDANKSFFSSKIDKIEKKSSDNGETYSIQLFNNSDVDLYINALALFYDKDGKIVDYSNIYGSDVAPGRSVNKSFDYKANYSKIDFEECKVIINEAYYLDN